MKKSIFYILMLSVLTVSCTNDELLTNESSAVVGFHALTSDVTTRAVNETNSLNMKNSPFEVYAFTHTDGKLFMGKTMSTGDYEPSEGVAIKYNDNGWGYANAKDEAYWPTDKLDFIAFHPYFGPTVEYIVEVSSAKKQVVRFVVPEVASAQKDLMYAITRGVDKNTNGGKVKLLFRHALSQACFKAKTELESMSVDIHDMKIHNLAISGELTLPQDRTDISINDWKPLERKSINYDPKELEKPIKEIGANAKEITAKMYLPQELTKWTPENKTIQQANEAKQSYLSILCTIKQNGVYLWGSENKPERLFVPFGVKWEPGKRYVYTLVFGGGYREDGTEVLDQIKFEVEEMPWEDTPYDVSTETNVNIN